MVRMCGNMAQEYGHELMFEFGDLETLHAAVATRDFKALISYDEATEGSISFLKALEARPDLHFQIWRNLDLLIAEECHPYVHLRYWRLLLKLI
jgi:hypothetical protein